MPHVGYAKEDGYHLSGIFNDGWGEVVDAKSVVYQYPPNKDTGNQGDPFLAVLLSIARVDPDSFKHTSDEVTEVPLKVDKDLDKIRPGLASEPGDPDPKDCGTDLGKEGNCFYAAEEGAKINENVKYFRLASSLQEKGFKGDILHRGYLPDLVGMVAYFQTLTGKKFRDDMEKDPTYFAVREIKRYPYEQAAKNGAKPPLKKAGKLDSKLDSKSVAPPDPKPAPEPEVEEEDAETVASRLIQEAAQASAGKTMAKSKFVTGVFLTLVSPKANVSKDLHKPIQTMIKSDWLDGVLEALEVNNEHGNLTFPGQS